MFIRTIALALLFSLSACQGGWDGFKAKFMRKAEPAAPVVMPGDAVVPVESESRAEEAPVKMEGGNKNCVICTTCTCTDGNQVDLKNLKLDGRDPNNCGKPCAEECQKKYPGNAKAVNKMSGFNFNFCT